MEHLATKLDLQKVIKDFTTSNWCKNKELANKVIKKLSAETFFVYANDIVSNSFYILKQTELLEMKDDIKKVCSEFEKWAILTEKYDSDFKDYYL